MARILILDERDSLKLDPLRHCLADNHDLQFASNIKDAMLILHRQPVDLIVSHSHLENSSVFDFLQSTKQDKSLREIPFICFNGQDNAIAKLLDEFLRRSTLLCGASAYLSVTDFGGLAECDTRSLRVAVEGCLSAHVQ